VSVPSKEQVNALIGQGLDYPEVGRRLGIPAGQAYLVGTGTPADGGHSTDEPDDRPGTLSSAQHLANPPHENPNSKQTVHDWIAGRVAADAQMRAAAAARRAREQADEEGS
jgi:hypothetical protein